METIESELPQISYGVFNKHNGVLFAFETEREKAYSYSKDNFVVKEVLLEPGQYYFGDYETGQVYYEEDKPLIREDELLVKHYQDIIQTYPIIEQLTNVIEVLDKNKEIIKTEKFEQMSKILKAKRLKYEHSIKSVQENKECFNFVSIKDLQDLSVKRLEGVA